MSLLTIVEDANGLNRSCDSLVKTQQQVPVMAGDNYHSVVTASAVSSHQRAVQQLWRDAQLLSKEWQDLASSFAEDPKTAQPEKFLSDIVKFVDLLDKSRVELIERKRKEEEKRRALPSLLQQEPAAIPSAIVNSGLDNLLTEKEKQAEISKRALGAVQNDPLMNELLQNMSKMVKDRRTLRANKRAQITSGATVFDDKSNQAVVLPVKDLAHAFVPPTQPKAVFKKK